MNIEDYDENKHGKVVVKSNLPDYDPAEHGETLPPPNDDGSIGRDARAKYFWYSIGDEGETWHGSQKVVSKDAKDKKEGKTSYDIAFGHKLSDEELKTNSIYGFPLADKAGNPLDLTMRS